MRIHIERVCGSFFFFSSRRRHTRSDRDWSSDVCSSDLDGGRGAYPARLLRGGPRGGTVRAARGGEVGRASGRGRVGISGGAGLLKKKKMSSGGGYGGTRYEYKLCAVCA